jgi:prepilin-type N-terminal cleavage/methylation domain-containing protein
MRKMRRFQSQGFTLLEILLALSLTAVVAALIGGLVQLYLVNESSGRDQVRQAQLARAILNMIAEDIRSTVRYQPFDASGLSQILGGGGGQPASAPPSNSGGGAAAASSSPSAASASDPSQATSTASLPPGIYGTDTSIEIDISRLPRPDEYFPLGSNMTTGTLGDLPSDIKTVAYFVQAPNALGIQDPLGGLEPINDPSTSSDTGGLVRRSLDRAVTQYAYEMGQTDSLRRTGELLAPEIVAIEFEYFDGAMWQLQWDSSTQGLPLVVRITIAIQKASKARTNPVEPGQLLSTFTADSMQEYGIELYSTITTIPGSQQLSSPQGSAASGTSSMGF